MKEKVIVSWSGCKESALALCEILKAGCYDVLGLTTTVTLDFDRISVHRVRHVLIEQQAISLDFPLEKMLVPKGVGDREYENKLLAVLEGNRNRAVSSVVFGDIFLEDVREYREQLLSKVGMKGVFPLWKRKTRELSHNFIDNGFKAIVTVVDSNFLGGEIAGRDLTNHSCRIFLALLIRVVKMENFTRLFNMDQIFAKRLPSVKVRLC